MSWNTKSRQSAWHVALATLVAGSAAGGPAPARAQAPPIPGVTSTFVLEGTVAAEWAGADALVVITADGVKHAFHAVKGVLVHGGPAMPDQLVGLKAGTVVAVHYTGDGDTAAVQEVDRLDADGLKTTEGTIVGIDRRRQTITVRFGARDTETFSITPTAAHHVGRDLDQPDGRPVAVTVYYRDEGGRKVAHFFKKTR